MEKSLDFDYIFKYILIGDASVGKSTLLNMFINNSYAPDNNPTMGVEFATKKLALRDKVIKIQIWDTVLTSPTQAGQESFRTITRAYYKNAIGIILVYDLHDPNSQATIDSWLAEIHDNSNQHAEIVIVGNKLDLVKPAALTPPKPHFAFFPTSGKTGAGVAKLFAALTQTVLAKIEKGTIDVDSVRQMRLRLRA